SLIEHFNYTANSTNPLEIQSAGIWSGTNSGVYVTEGSLSYVGLTGSGNKVSFQGNADGVFAAFDASTTPYAQNVYYSFLFQVKNVPTSTSTDGDYFIRFNNGSASNSIVPI